MDKNWKCVFKTFVKKEFIEIRNSLLNVVILCVVCSNLMQFMTINQIAALDIETEIKALNIGFLLVYMVVMINLFLGQTLLHRFIFDEKNSKSIQVMIASGMSKTALWASKLLVAIIASEIVCLVSIALNWAIVKFYFDISITFSISSAVMVFVAMPILSFGILALISVAYSYFNNMSIFGMIFPIVAYIGIWNLSMQLAIYFLPLAIVGISIGIGLSCVTISMYLIRTIPTERYVKKDV